VLVACIAVPSGARAQTSERESAASPPPETFNQFLDDTVRSPYPYAYAFAGSVLDQITGFPSEWNGSSGFAKRTAARVGQGIVADSIAHGAAAIAAQRITYDPCRCSGKADRTRHALSRAFVAVRTDGSRAPNWPLWLSKYSSSGVANAWYPDSYTRRDVIEQATSAIAISAGLNVLREFAHFK